jgi:hypothetical protein
MLKTNKMLQKERPWFSFFPLTFLLFSSLLRRENLDVTSKSTPYIIYLPSSPYSPEREVVPEEVLILMGQVGDRDKSRTV